MSWNNSLPQLFCWPDLHTVALGDIKRIFELTDRYRVSNPMVKIYLPDLKLSTNEFLSVFNKEILPLTKSTDYIDYYSSAETLRSVICLYKNSGNSNSKPSFVFTYRPALPDNITPVFGPTFCIYNLSIENFSVAPKSLNELTGKTLILELDIMLLPKKPLRLNQ